MPHLQFKFTPFLLAGAVVLAACSEDATTPLTRAPAEAAYSTDELVPADRFIYVFDEKSIPADFEARVAAAGGAIERKYGPLGIASVRGLSPEAAASLGGAADVAFWNHEVETTLDRPAGEPETDAGTAADEPSSPANPATAFHYARQWNMRAIGANHAWAAGRLGSSSVKVGILDTGLDYTHVDLAGRVDLALSKSFVPSDNSYIQANLPGVHEIADLHYHGTHVGATVASNAIRAAGVTSKVTLVGIKVLSRTGSGSSQGILDGITYAADIGLDVINMSLGIAAPLSRDQYGWFNEIVNRAFEYAFEKGVVVVVSAGNENMDLGHLNGSFKAYCTASTVTCVSATGPTASGGTLGPWTNVDAKAGYSNYGRTHISVAAPGGTSPGLVWAACSSFSLVIPACRPGTLIVGLGGTSMASPHVAGLAALIAEQTGKRQPGLIRQRLQQSADDLGQPGTDPVYGKGRINVVKALGL